MIYDLTNHARESLRKRLIIRLGWIESVLQKPDFIESDPIDSELEHRLGRIHEYEGRVLRIIVKKGTTPLRVITLYFDLQMRRQL